MNKIQELGEALGKAARDIIRKDVQRLADGSRDVGNEYVFHTIKMLVGADDDKKQDVAVR